MGLMRSKNINAWTAKTKAARQKIQGKATDYVQKQARIIAFKAIEVSPQWSGNYAASWTIETSNNPVSNRTTVMREFKVNPWYSLRGSEKQVGHPDAVNYAKRLIALDIADNVKWNSRISLVNTAEVAEKLEAGQVKLRPENLVPAGQGVLNYLKTKYKVLR